jgi:hypothetical protein
VVVLLFALLVQGTAVQAHLHFARHVQAPAVTSSERAIHASADGAGDSSTDCRLCQEAAMAGAYLLPPATVLPAPPALVPWLGSAALNAFQLVAPALGWQSRAPPR